MTARTRGIHHVTCIAGNPQQNVDFYVGVMGMRLVKRSVNQDVPHTYHLFYADSTGTPGTDLTFFPWPDMPPAHPGPGLAMEVSFVIPPGSLDWWRDRLQSFRVAVGADETRFGERVLSFKDPHGLNLALVETQRKREFTPWLESGVPVQHQLHGMDCVRLWERDVKATSNFLTTVLGFEIVGEEDGWTRFSVAASDAGTMVDVREVSSTSRGRWGTGGIHHVAWRVLDVDAQLALRADVEEAGRRPTQLIDRFWFTSVYFLEPGGVLFELATEGPGFDRDESPDALGEKLILPPWLEHNRTELESALPVLTIPE